MIFNDYEWLKILCVEDEEEARELYKETLEIVFPHISVAANGEEGLERFGEIKPHIVISDIRMPRKNGLEMAREIKALEPKTIIILASAHSESEYLYDAIQAGVDGFVNKPVKTNELIKKIKEHAQKIWQEEAYLSTKLLLEEYKEAVDESLLVSKTDAQGVITYANDAFVEISGFTKEELIGQNHRIVRHPDMSDEFFANMWETITSGKTWKGVVKNSKRDGGYYVVDSTIKPILNREGGIIEYISMRRDITEQEKYRKYLQKQLGTKEHDLQEKLTLLSQYEKAIELSTAFCRTNKEEKITYANETFCEILGLNQDEIIGIEKKDFLESSDSSCSLEGESHYWSGQVSVFRKDRSIRHLQSTLVPIYDNNHKIIEYMSISHDITKVIELQEEIQETQKEFLYRLGEMAELRSKETGQHVRRVASFAAVLAKAASLPSEEVELIKLASPMHDAGKIAISDEILNKPGKLTTKEFEIMKNHALIGYEMFRDSEREILKAAALIAYSHHEKWDGSGYPRSLSGEEIPLWGRIVAIADVYDALGCDRIYKKGWEQDRIISFFKEQSGKHFDPSLVELFFEIMPEILDIKERYVD